MKERNLSGLSPLDCLSRSVTGESVRQPHGTVMWVSWAHNSERQQQLVPVDSSSSASTEVS